MAKWKKRVDMAIANHLDAHVMGGYEFLMEQCLFFEAFVTERKRRCSSFLLDHAEDKICIFGFSRGAYTARALAGMINKVWFFHRHIGGPDHDMLGRRLVYFPRETTNRFPSRTICTFATMKQVGNRALRLRRLFLWTLRSNSLVYGIPVFPSADRLIGLTY
jgi:hypothetical protein